VHLRRRSSHGNKHLLECKSGRKSATNSFACSANASGSRQRFKLLLYLANIICAFYTRKETRINICQHTHSRSLLLVARARATSQSRFCNKSRRFVFAPRGVLPFISRSALHSLAYNIYVSRADVMSSYLPLKIVLGTQNQQIIAALYSHELRKATNLRGRPTYLVINHLKISSTLLLEIFHLRPTKCSSTNRRRKTIGTVMHVFVRSVQRLKTHFVYILTAMQL
jgi:hypothetical protein